MASGIHFKCSCGRALRVSKHRAGTMVRCWDCRQSILAPMPDLRESLVRDLREAAREALDYRIIGVCALAAAVITGGLMLGRAGLALLAVAGLVAAVAMRDDVLMVAEDAAKALRKRPIASLLVALVLPLSALAVEALTVASAHEQDWLRYLVLDVAPRSATVAAVGPIEDSWTRDIDLLSTGQVLSIYRHGVRRGFPLLYAVPLSLTRGSELNLNSGYAYVNAVSWAMRVQPETYLAFRAFCTFLMLTAMLAAVGLQARCFERIATLEERYLASFADATPDFDRSEPPAVTEDLETPPDEDTPSVETAEEHELDAVPSLT